MSKSYIDDMEEPMSDCCDAPIIYSDICSKCKERCSAIVTCQRCKGTGEYHNGFEMNGCDCENGYIYLED